MVKSSKAVNTIGIEKGGEGKGREGRGRCNGNSVKNTYDDIRVYRIQQL